MLSISRSFQDHFGGENELKVTKYWQVMAWCAIWHYRGLKGLECLYRTTVVLFPYCYRARFGCNFPESNKNTSPCIAACACSDWPKSMFYQSIKHRKAISLLSRCVPLNKTSKKL